jgi:hypothetical protein
MVEPLQMYADTASVHTWVHMCVLQVAIFIMYVFYLKRLLTDEPIERLKIFFSGEKCFEEFILI